MGLIKGTFSEGWGWRVSSGLTSSHSKVLNIQGEDSLNFSIGDTISSYSYKNFNANQFTVACKVQLYSTGQTMYILDWYGDNDNYISMYISSSNTVNLKYKANGTERSVSITPTIVSGTQYCAVFRADRNSYVDSSNYLRIDWGETSILTSGGTSSVLGSLAAADATFTIGGDWKNNGSNCYQGRVWMWILNYSLETSEVTSFMNTSLSSEPICDTNTLFMFNGTMSSSLPQAIFYDSSGSTVHETFEAGVSSYVGYDSSVIGDTTNPLNDLQSLSVSGTTRGGYAEKSYSVAGSTKYYMEIAVKGLNTEYLAVSIEGNDSGVLKMDNFQADGNLQIRRFIFTTGASDTSVKVRLADDLDNSQYFWNGNFLHLNTWDSININWENLV